MPTSTRQRATPAIGVTRFNVLDLALTVDRKQDQAIAFHGARNANTKCLPLRSQPSCLTS